MNIHILYADRDLLICEKPAGMPSQPDPSGQTDLLTTLAETYETVSLVHRLDTPTGGVMVYGLNPTATSKLCALVQDHDKFCKEYLAVISRAPQEPQGELRDYLFHDKRANKSFVTDGARKGSKEAVLTYRTLATDIPLTDGTAPCGGGHTLVAVRLLTGRTHQIRVQFASRGMPLVGDGKYGSREKCPCIALWSYRVTFPHPRTGRTVSAEALPDLTAVPWSYFREIPDPYTNFHNRKES